MRCRVFTARILLVTLLLVVLFNEYLIYIFKAFFVWPTISCSNGKLCTKILIVADPQILGEMKENALARFDCDKFLRNTFSMAYDYVAPNGVIFLGDLIDEGSLASDDEFERYYHRLRNIFQLRRLYSFNVPTVFIPGDNDIGGEGYDEIRHETVKRFAKYFGDENTVMIKSVRIFKVNKLLHTFSRMEDIFYSNITLNLIISHLPLTDHSSQFTSQIIEDLKPDFILSAHEHKSYAVLSLREGDKSSYYQPLKQNFFRNGSPSWTFSAASKTNFNIVTELTAPTCSYRMGETEVGYGVIVQDDTDPFEITYYILWSPSRFFCLQLYIGMLVMTGFVVCSNWASVRRKFKFRRSYSRY